MTTKVTVDAHAGWDVEVTTVQLPARTESKDVVPANTVRDFYVYSNAELHVKELEHK